MDSLITEAAKGTRKFFLDRYDDDRAKLKAVRHVNANTQRTVWLAENEGLLKMIIDEATKYTDSERAATIVAQKFRLPSFWDNRSLMLLAGAINRMKKAGIAEPEADLFLYLVAHKIENQKYIGTHN